MGTFRSRAGRTRGRRRKGEKGEEEWEGEEEEWGRGSPGERRSSMMKRREDGFGAGGWSPGGTWYLPLHLADDRHAEAGYGEERGSYRCTPLYRASA